ncbi:hypothetical protein ACI2KT_27315 [Ensifer adhaerens]|uniref:hypothetical protein n=1 Tax=Ensifer adhaerens TaxID=106592 RepID=UPI00384FB892
MPVFFAFAAPVSRQSPGRNVDRGFHSTDSRDGLRKPQEITMCGQAQMGERDRLIDTPRLRQLHRMVGMKPRRTGKVEEILTAPHGFERGKSDPCQIVIERIATSPRRPALPKPCERGLKAWLVPALHASCNGSSKGIVGAKFCEFSLPVGQFAGEVIARSGALASSATKTANLASSQRAKPSSLSERSSTSASSRSRESVRRRSGSLFTTCSICTPQNLDFRCLAAMRLASNQL